MKSIAFTYPVNIEDEHKLLIDLFEEGIDFLHVRKPDLSFGALIQYLNKVPNEFHNRIVLHDHFSLIGEFDLAGINLNSKSIGQLVLEEEVDKCYIQPLVQTEDGIEVNRNLAKQVSYSAHSFEEIDNLTINASYVFLSPIFDSITKFNYKSSFLDHEKLKKDLSIAKKNIIALGGVSNDKIKLCEELGFAGYARLGDAWKNSITIEE